MKHAILCVDDEVDNVDSLERLFRKSYSVFKATSAADALKILSEQKITVIISDQRMPQMSGVEFLSASIKTHPNAIRILLTGYTDVESIIAAINSGQIYRYVTKPWDPVDLANAVDKAVERFELSEELREKNLALTQALEDLQSLDHAKNHFMILVNHELKTPLTSILSFSDLLGESALDPDQTTYLNRIRSSAQRLQEMVNDVLELISAETSQMKIDPHPMKARHLFSNVPDIVNTILRQRKLTCDFQIDNQDLIADEKLIRNVFRRLIHNAAKFATPGSKIRVEGRSLETTYELSVINQGVPIEDAKIRMIMKPFSLNENILNHSTGTGLGLSVCQALLRLHSSHLSFTSTNDEIRVSFILPKAPTS